jgi:hypothetical protein
MNERPPRFPEWLSLVAGTILSVVLGALFYFRTDLKSAVAAFAGLLGVAIALQLELLLQSRRLAAAQRSRELRAGRIEEVDWLPHVVDGMLTALHGIRDGQPVSLVSDLAKVELESCVERLRDLQRGHLTDQRPQEMDIVDILTLRTRHHLHATTGEAELTWWLRPEARYFLQRQADAVARGVAIERIFIYDVWTELHDEICRLQRKLGIEVYRIEARKIAGISYPDLIIWDDVCALSVDYNSAGDNTNSRFTFVTNEIRKLEHTFRIAKSAAELFEPHEPA